MTDRSFGIYPQMLRTPDLRLDDVRSELIAGDAPFFRRFEAQGRGMLILVRKGTAIFELENSARPAIHLVEGAVIGIEDGRAQTWRSDSETVELFVSTIPRRMSVLQKLSDGIVVVPPDSLPFATILRQSVELQIAEIAGGYADRDPSVVRRCAEIGLIQLVRFAQSSVAAQPDAPAGLAHDEHLLRAWSAYFAEPRRRWTVKALAEAAGLGRTAFSQRFHDVFGTPPLHTMTMLRLKQAEGMLRDTQAPLIEIAFSVGYNSEAAFVRAFHREYGVPPGRFRTAAKDQINAAVVKTDRQPRTIDQSKRRSSQ